MEALQTYRVNLVSFHLALGDHWWFIVGCYLAPENALTIDDIVEATSQRPWGATMVVVGYFNTNLAASEGQERDKGIAADMAEEGL